MNHYNKNNPQTICEMFDSIAQNYDKTNGVLSFQMHKRWNQSLVQEVILPSHPQRYLDLCCGTGAIAFDFLKQTKEKPKVYMLDFSQEMLNCAKSRIQTNRLIHHDISFLRADAQSIPLPDQSIDCATIAYGIRNIKSPKLCLEDTYRVLKKGGVFGILELTRPSNRLLRLGHWVYLRTLFPILGKLLTSNKEAYRYLCNSIHTFIPPEQLEALMLSAGFKDLKKMSLMGGIATIVVGKK